LEEAQRLIQTLVEMVPLIGDPLKVTQIVRDVGENGQINDPEFRPLFQRLAEVAGEALI
jgi:hypothetical protein